MSANNKQKVFFLSKSDMILLRRAFGYVKPHMLLFIGTFLSIILGMLVEIIQPLYYGKVIDHILQKEINLMMQALFFIFGLTIINGAVSLLETYWTDLLGNKIIIDIKQDLYNHVLNLPVKVYDELRVGEFISRLEGDVGTLSNIITYQAMRIILDVAKIFGIGFLIFKLNITLSWIIVCAFPLTYLVLGWFGRILRRKGKMMRELNDHYYSFLAESFAGVREVKALHLEELVRRKFMDWTMKIFHLRINTDVVGALSGLSTMMLNSVTNLVVMGVGGFFIVAGKLTMGTYVAFNSYAGQFSGSLGRVADLNSSVQQAMVALERIFSLIDNFMLPPEKREGLKPVSTHGELNVDKVVFGYAEELQVVKKVSFTAYPGQMTALVGASGSGKTTLFNLFLRFYQIDDGQITLDGHPLNELHLDYLREAIAIVPQEPFLFNMSIKDNLLLAKPDATMDEVVEAAEKAYIHHFIESLPEGYNTVIGERGTKLSGGQKQRLAIARAILKKSKILLFDEATSALDGESEEVIQKTLQNLTPDHTILVIAHRLSTVINANQIVVLADGQIVGKGTHQELIKSNPVYQRLYQSQYNSMMQGNLLDEVATVS